MRALRSKPNVGAWMKRSCMKLWSTLIINSLVIAILVMLLIPTGLTTDQLRQIHSGMRIAEVKQLLGQENGHANIAASTPGIFWMKYRRWWNPSLQAKLEAGAEESLLLSGGFAWFNDALLLVVDHHNGIVTKTWLFPLTSTGSGLQGCIDTIKQYWNQWWSK